MLTQLAINGLVVGSLYALVTLGFSLILSVTKIWHFAHGGIFTIAAYVLWSMTVKMGMPTWVGFLVAIIFVPLVAVLINTIVYGTLRKKNAPNLIFFVSSLITAFLIQNVLALIFTTDAKGYPASTAESGLAIGPAILTSLDIKIILTSMSLFILFLVFYRYTKWGRMMKAISDNQEMAEIIGINVKRIYQLVFVVGSILTIPAAYMVSVHQGITPTLGFNILLIAVTASVVGGLGNVPGAIVGAYIVGLLESIGVWKIASEWQLAIVFGLLFFVIIIKPTGLFGKVVK